MYLKTERQQFLALNRNRTEPLELDNKRLIYLRSVFHHHIYHVASHRKDTESTFAYTSHCFAMIKCLKIDNESTSFW